MKTKIGTFGAKFYTYVWGLNVPGDDMECEHFTVISINSFFVHKKKKLHATIIRQLSSWNCRQVDDRLSLWPSVLC